MGPLGSPSTKVSNFTYCRRTRTLSKTGFWSRLLVRYSRPFLRWTREEHRWTKNKEIVNYTKSLVHVLIRKRKRRKMFRDHWGLCRWNSSGIQGITSLVLTNRLRYEVWIGTGSALWWSMVGLGSPDVVVMLLTTDLFLGPQGAVPASSNLHRLG